jgi:Na+/proline symporter
VALLSITSLLGVSGLALLYYYLQHPDQLPEGVSPTSVGDALMPHFFATQLPLGFGGLILANFLCDAMQTLVSGVNSITAVATQDVLEHGGVLRTTSKSRLNVARMLTVVLGCLTTGIALGVAWLANSSGKNIFDLMPKTFNLFIGPMGSLFLIGMFLPRVTGRTATPAVLLALGVSIVWNYWREILSIPLVRTFTSGVIEQPVDLSMSWAYAVSCVAGIIFAAILSLLFEKGGDHPGRRFTWWAVMQRPVPTAQAD